MIEGERGKPFSVSETGWGEFEITMKLYYVTESGEKPQTLYHHLRLHPFGRNEEEKESVRGPNGTITSWSYDEQIFNEPYDAFYEILTTGAHPKGHQMPSGAKGAKGKGKPIPPLPTQDANVVWERSALIPATNKPGQPFSRETEQLEIKKLEAATRKAQEMHKQILATIKEKEDLLRRLREESAADPPVPTAS